MTLKIGRDDARLDVYKPGNLSTDPADRDLTIRDGNLERLDVSARASNWVDTGTIVVENPEFRYSGEVSSGDRVEFYVRHEGETDPTRRWTGMIRNMGYDRLAPNRGEMNLEVDDYVYGILDTRTVVGGYEDRQIAGPSDAILNRILRQEAPEIDRSLIGTITETATVQWDSTSLLDAVKELADYGDAIMWADGLRLGFDRIEDRPTLWGLTPADKGLHSVHEDDDELANVIRVKGGKGVQLDDEQATQTGYYTVTDSDRLTRQISTRKSEVTRVELWTDPTQGNGDALTVRLQADDGGAPVDPSSEESDLARRTLAESFLKEGGYTRFLMPEHTLPEPDPWLIIEADDSNGQAVGVNDSNVPTYEAYYPFPIDTVLEVGDSIDEYGRREKAYANDTLKRQEDTVQFARTIARRVTEPSRTIEFPAESRRAHDLEPADVIEANYPEESLVGDVIVTDVNHTYDGTTLETDITAQEVETL